MIGHRVVGYQSGRAENTGKKTPPACMYFAPPLVDRFEQNAQTVHMSKTAYLYEKLYLVLQTKS